MTIHITDLNQETRVKIGIQTEPPLEQSSVRHIALGKVLKAIARLKEEDALWVLQYARHSLGRQGNIVNNVLTSDNSYVPPIDWVIQVVARGFNVSISDLKRRSRTEEIVKARQVAMYLLNMTGVYTLERIGQSLGGRTPATVSYGFQRVAKLLSSDKGLAEMVNLIKEELR